MSIRGGGRAAITAALLLTAAVSAGATPASAASPAPAGHQVAPSAHGTVLPASPRSHPGSAPARAAAPSVKAGALNATAPLPGSHSPQPGRSATAASTHTAVFSSLDQPGLSAADSSGLAGPPATSAAAGHAQLVETAGSQIAVFDLGTLARVASEPLDAFTGMAGYTISEAQVEWDEPGGRWLYAAQAAAPGDAGLALGWSLTGDPRDLAGGWCRLYLPAATQYGAPLLPARPRLGHDDSFIVVTSDVVDGGGAFVTANVLAVPKPGAGAACPGSSAPATYSSYGAPAQPLLNTDGSPARALVPAQNLDVGADILLSLRGIGGGGPVLAGQWRLSPPPTGLTQLADISLPTAGLAPDPAITTGGGAAAVLDTGDGSPQELYAAPDPQRLSQIGLWTAHTIGVNAGGAVRPAVRWYELVNGQVAQSGDIATPTGSVFNGAIAPDVDGDNAVATYNLLDATGLQVVASSRTATSAPGTLTGTDSVIARSPARVTDACVSSGGQLVCPWGDTSSVSPDPVRKHIVWAGREIAGTDCGSCSAGTATWSTVNAAVTTVLGGRLHTTAATRIVDTRPASQVGARGTPLAAGETLAVAAGGLAGIPSTGVSAVAVNVTATDTSANGYLTLWPHGVSRPLASNLNWPAGATVADMVEVGVGAGGVFDVYNPNGSTDLVVDVLGWYGTPDDTGPDGLLQPLAPARILDTRAGAPGILGPGASIAVQVTNKRGPVPAGEAGAVLVNVTVTDTSSDGYLTVWPTGAPMPATSNLNWRRGQTIANRALVPLSAGGQLSVYNSSGRTDVVLDVTGWFTSASSFTGGLRLVPLAPARVLDTRPASHVGVFSGFIGGVTILPVTGFGGVPAMTSATPPGAVVMTMTVADGHNEGYLTAYPGGALLPLASDINWAPGSINANLVVTQVAAATTGQISVYVSAPVDVIVDVSGYYG